MMFGTIGLVRADDAPASGSTGSESGWVKGACKADVEKLCPGVKPGKGAIRDCLKQHESELSAVCQNNIKMAKERMEQRKAEITAACKADTDQFCKDITPGEGREMACLHAHNDKISQGCKDALKMRHEKGGAPAAPAASKS